MPPAASSRALPKRTDSLQAIKNPQLFIAIEDEVRDCKRVQTHGQEEDLKEALSRMMSRVEELVRIPIPRSWSDRSSSRVQ